MTFNVTTLRIGSARDGVGTRKVATRSGRAIIQPDGISKRDETVLEKTIRDEPRLAPCLKAIQNAQKNLNLFKFGFAVEYLLALSKDDMIELMRGTDGAKRLRRRLDDMACKSPHNEETSQLVIDLMTRLGMKRELRAISKDSDLDNRIRGMAREKLGF